MYHLFLLHQLKPEFHLLFFFYPPLKWEMVKVTGQVKMSVKKRQLPWSTGIQTGCEILSVRDVGVGVGGALLVTPVPETPASVFVEDVILCEGRRETLVRWAVSFSLNWQHSLKCNEKSLNLAENPGRRQVAEIRRRGSGPLGALPIKYRGKKPKT